GDCAGWPDRLSPLEADVGAFEVAEVHEVSRRVIQMTMRSGSALAIVATFLILSAPVVRAVDDDKDEGDQSAVVKALSQAKVSLNQGLLASTHEGTPISAKFEMEDGKLQLSVYTMKADKFSEVGVDPISGKVVNIEAITEGEDLAAAKAQRDAM